MILKWKLGRLKDRNSQTVADTKHQKNQRGRSTRPAKPMVKVAALEALQVDPRHRFGDGKRVILTVCYPREFTVIDWRVLEGTRPISIRTCPLLPSELLTKRAIITTQNTGLLKTTTANNYRRYAHALDFVGLLTSRR